MTDEVSHDVPRDVWKHQVLNTQILKLNPPYPGKLWTMCWVEFLSDYIRRTSGNH